MNNRISRPTQNMRLRQMAGYSLPSSRSMSVALKSAIGKLRYSCADHWRYVINARQTEASALRKTSGIHVVNGARQSAHGTRCTASLKERHIGRSPSAAFCAPMRYAVTVRSYTSVCRSGSVFSSGMTISAPFGAYCRTCFCFQPGVTRSQWYGMTIVCVNCSSMPRPGMLHAAQLTATINASSPPFS